MKKHHKRKYTISIFFVLIACAISRFGYLDISVEDIKKEYSNADSNFMELDEMFVHYRDEGKGFPIVLIHGTASSLHTWNAWTNELKKTNRVIRMDLPAFGITGPNKNADYSIKGYTTFLHSFLKKLNIEKFHIVGNSLGGNIAWNYAAENPTKIEKLILVDASGLPTNKPRPKIFEMAKKSILSSFFLYITPRILIEKNMKAVYANDAKVTEELITRYHKMVLRVGNRQAFIDRAKIDFNLGAKKNIDKLKSIQTPTLLIWGAQDNWIPLDTGKRMNALIPNSKLAIILNSGHIPMEENPTESFKILMNFLEN